MSRIYGAPGLFGETIYTDETGKYVGESRPGFFGEGSQDFYDASGRHVGYADPSIFGGSNVFSDQSGFAGYTVPSVFGGETVHDQSGSCVGWAMDTPLGPIADFSDPFEF